MRVRVLIDWLEHDGARRQPGEELDLTPAAAAPLIALGAVEPIEEPPAANGAIEVVIDAPAETSTRRGGRRAT
jgi:hypothetical protein